MKLTHMTLKEFIIQIALGSLSEEYRNNLCRYKTPEVSKGLRTCYLCGLKCINKDDEFYLIEIGVVFKEDFNICKTCSWLSIQTINRIITEHNTKSE